MRVFKLKLVSAFFLTSLVSVPVWAGVGAGCSVDQNLAFTKAETVVANRLNELVTMIPGFNLQYVYNNFIVPEHRTYTEGSQANADYGTYLSKLQSVFTRMQVEAQRGIEFECKDSNIEPNCQGGETIAYVLFYGPHAQKRMYLCSGFFSKSGANQSLDQQSQTAFHELSHYAADTDDLAGDWRTPQFTDIVKAPDDAYHIEMFVSGDVQRLLRNQIWYWNWPKAKSTEVAFK